MHIPCEIYYEKYLGDCCNNDCDNCFGDKDVYECTEDFEVTGETILDKAKIEKGDWFWAHFINDDHVLLRNGTDHWLRLQRKYFDKYFTSEFIVRL